MSINNFLINSLSYSYGKKVFGRRMIVFHLDKYIKRVVRQIIRVENDYLYDCVHQKIKLYLIKNFNFPINCCSFTQFIGWRILTFYFIYFFIKFMLSRFICCCLILMVVVPGILIIQTFLGKKKNTTQYNFHINPSSCFHIYLSLLFSQIIIIFSFEQIDLFTIFATEFKLINFILCSVSHQIKVCNIISIVLLLQAQ